MVQSANVITLLKRWWTTNTTPNAFLNLRFLVFSWKKGGGSGSVSHWSLPQKKVTTWRILRKPKRSLAKGKICLNLHLGSSMLQKSCYLHLPIIVCNNHNFQKNPVMRCLNHWKVTGSTGKLPNLNQFLLDFVFAGFVAAMMYIDCIDEPFQMSWGRAYWSPTQQVFLDSCRVLETTWRWQ